MRVIFVVHPCNRSIIQSKMDSLHSRGFNQILIVLSEFMYLNTFYVKYHGKNFGQSFRIRNGKVEEVNDILVH